MCQLLEASIFEEPENSIQPLCTQKEPTTSYKAYIIDYQQGPSQYTQVFEHSNVLQSLFLRTLKMAEDLCVL